jgi:hypothetical protein
VPGREPRREASSKATGAAPTPRARRATLSSWSRSPRCWPPRRGST